MNSENRMMRIKTYLFYNRKGFLLLVFLFAGVHIMKASCRSEGLYTQTKPDGEAKIVISEGSVISGLEHLYIASAKAKKTCNQPKNLKKKRVKRKLDSKKAENQIYKSGQNLKPAYNFSDNSKSDTYLYNSVLSYYAFGCTLFSFKCITANEVKILGVLLFIICIFLINFYKSRSLFDCYFSQNYQRPPPGFILSKYDPNTCHPEELGILYV